MLATSREGGVIGRFEIESHQRKYGSQKTLSLAQWEIEDEAQRQSRLNRVIGELPLSRPVGAGFQTAIASSEIQRVISPRWTRARSYLAQLLTRYLVLYLGWTLDLIERLWRINQSIAISRLLGV